MSFVLFFSLNGASMGSQSDEVNMGSLHNATMANYYMVHSENTFHKISHLKPTYTLDIWTIVLL